MLFNKNWEQPKIAELSLEGLIAWLETKDPNEVYSYVDPNRCLLGQWTKSIDRNSVSQASFYYWVNGKTWDLYGFQPIAYPNNESGTFGDALERARFRLKRKMNDAGTEL